MVGHPCGDLRPRGDAQSRKYGTDESAYGPIRHTDRARDPPIGPATRYENGHALLPLGERTADAPCRGPAAQLPVERGHVPQRAGGLKVATLGLKLTTCRRAS